MTNSPNSVSMIMGAPPDSVTNVQTFVAGHSLSLLGVIVGICVVVYALLNKGKRAMVVLGVALIGMMMIVDPGFFPAVATALGRKALLGQ